MPELVGDVGAAAPLIAIVVVAVLVLLFRWLSHSGQSVARPARGPGRPDDYGLLVPLFAPDADTAEATLAVLRAEGIRAFLIDTTQGRMLMVFEPDLDHALRILLPLPDDGTDDPPAALR